VLADIMLGRITRWDDPKLNELTMGFHLPSEEIVVVHRSDGSGTTYILVGLPVEDEFGLEINHERWGLPLRWQAGIGAKGTRA